MGKASMETLSALWRELLAALLGRFKGTKQPPVELLQVSRRFLRDNGQGCPDDKTRQQLAQLYRQYLGGLARAMDEAPPSASLLAEARAFLQWHGVGDIPGASAGHAAKQLLDLSVPFKTKPH